MSLLLRKSLFGAALCAGMFFSTELKAQQLTHLWTGLRQEQAEMPKGNAPAQTPSPKAYEKIATLLVPAADREWILQSGWELIDGPGFIQGKTPWYNATVPGTILTTLIDQGVYPHPYYGLNNMAIPESLCRTDWWYKLDFSLPKEAVTSRNKYLLFNGINYKSEVYLNGKIIGKTFGAFSRGRFDISDFLNKSGANQLLVHVYPPNNPGIPHEQTMEEGQGLNGGMLSLDGPTFISSMGWDWVPGIRDRNTGIWQDVRLICGDAARIGDPLVITRLALPDTTHAFLTIRTPLRNDSPNTIKGMLKAQIEGISVQQEFTLGPNQEKEILLSPKSHPQLQIENPRLWWPNGYGAQPLYSLTLTTQIDGQPSDSKTLKFGIRELSYELMAHDAEKGNVRYAFTPAERTTDTPLFNYVNRHSLRKGLFIPTLNGSNRSALQELPADDPVGEFFVLRVNGVRIFCRGGNWGMDDALKRSSREQLEPYFQLHKDLNFNIIRNWTGESTEESFYSLCDEYGMLVWNDFWITTDDTVEPNDFALFMSNVRETVLRFRNHPSIAVWCPRNEGFAPNELEIQISSLIAKEDPTRHYHGQSRFLNMGTSGPWGYFKDLSYYFNQRPEGFNTEMGAFAIPTAETLRKFIAPEDLWPINDVWAYHDLHQKSQNYTGFMEAVGEFGQLSSADDFSAKSQFVCYDAWRAMLEGWNSHMWNNTTGLILWMSHPAWPSMIWQTYTYDGETPGSYFGAKKACEPLHVQYHTPSREVAIVNVTRQDLKHCFVTATYYDIDGKKRYQRTENVTIAAANSLTKCFVLDNATESLSSDYLLRLELKDIKGHLISRNDYLMAQPDTQVRLAEHQPAQLELRTRLGKTTKGALSENTLVEVTNRSKQMALGIKLIAKDAQTQQQILPALFSDGYFNLLPGEKRTITLDLPRQEVLIQATQY